MSSIPSYTEPTTLPALTMNHLALNQLIPSVLSGKNGSALISELTNNNLSLANKIINLYYRIKKNVEYMSDGKQSLHSVQPFYSTSGTNLLNSRASRQYFYLIHKNPNSSFGHVIRMASYLVQNNKLKWIQNSKGLSGPKLIK